jgi:hypothetical protein
MIRTWLSFLSLFSSLLAFATPAKLCIQSLIREGTLQDPFVFVATDGGVQRNFAVENFLLERDSLGVIRVSSQHAKVATQALSRSPQAQAQMNQRLRRVHGLTENSFRLKAQNPNELGQMFVPDVHASVVPIAEEFWTDTVQSTGPVLRALRKVLQAFYSNPNATVADLGLQHLPPTEAALFLSTLKQSIYFEPELVHANLKDYPFLMVGGFDAAIDTLSQPTGTFFEFNLGTPSGLSNNIQLLEALRLNDHRLLYYFLIYLHTLH